MKKKLIKSVSFLTISVFLSIQTLFSSYVDVNAQEYLTKALCKNDVEEALAAIKNGANPLAIDMTGETALHTYLIQQSSKRDTIETIRMIDQITDVIKVKERFKDREAIFGRIGLFLGQKPHVESEESFSLDTEDKNGITPLGLSIILGYNRIAHIFQDKGADINYKSHTNGNTIMHHIAAWKTCISNYNDLLKSSHLAASTVKKPIPVTTATKPKYNFVIPKKAATAAASAALIEKLEEEIALLRALEMKSDINSRNNELKTPLMIAVINKNYSIINELLWFFPEPIKPANGKIGLSLRLPSRDLKLRDTFNKSALDYAREIPDFNQDILTLLKIGTEG